MANPKGQRYGAGKVKRYLPCLMEWGCKIEIVVLDDYLQDNSGIKKIKEYLEHAGRLGGVGCYRPSIGGTYGRFDVTAFKV
jgi:hypothetical protein